MAFFTNELWAHAHVIGVALPCEEVRIVLGNAIQTYQKEVLGIDQVRTGKVVLAGKSWKRLAKSLISKDEQNKIKKLRWEREWKEGDEKAQAAVDAEAAEN